MLLSICAFNPAVKMSWSSINEEKLPPNARHELLGRAGARDEWTLFPVSSMPGVRLGMS